MARFSRRHFIQLIALTGILTGAGTNCRRSPLISEASGPEPGLHWRRFADTEITLLLNDHPWTQGVQPYLKEFESLTGIQIRLEIVPEPDYFQAMAATIRADPVRADVFFLPMDSTAYRFWRESRLLSLTPLINDPQLTAPTYNLFDFPEGFRLAAMYPPESEDKELFGIPATFEAYILFYNQQLVNQYLNGQLPKTLDELVLAAADISQRGQGEVFGAVMRGIESDAIIDTVTGIVLDCWGSSATSLPYNVWFEHDWLTPRLQDPRIVKGLETYARLMQAAPPDIKTMDWPAATQLFRAGKAAFYIDASLFGPGHENPEESAIADQVGYAALPPQHQTSLTGHWLWGLGIPQGSRQPQAAWMFIQWATSPAMEAKIGVKTGGAPRFSSWLTPSVFTEAMNVDYALAVQTAMQTSRSTAVLHPNWNQAAQAIAATLHQIYDGVEADVAAAQLQSRIKQIMALASTS